VPASTLPGVTGRPTYGTAGVIPPTTTPQ
jgi:hypothetical protein